MINDVIEKIYENLAGQRKTFYQIYCMYEWYRMPVRAILCGMNAIKSLDVKNLRRDNGTVSQMLISSRLRICVAGDCPEFTAKPRPRLRNPRESLAMLARSRGKEEGEGARYAALKSHSARNGLAKRGRVYFRG